MAGFGPGAPPRGAPSLDGTCPELDYAVRPDHAVPSLQESAAKPDPPKPCRNGPVGQSYRIKKPDGGYLSVCACGNACDGRACRTCGRKEALAGALYWCRLCRSRIDSRSRFCGRCCYLRAYDRARKSRASRGVIHDVRSSNNRTGALARVSSRSSAEIRLPGPAPPVQPFRTPYLPAHGRGGKARCGCGSIAAGRACSTHGRIERTAGIMHPCRLCRTLIAGASRRCGRCRGLSSFDSNRRRHRLDGHAYDYQSWRNRTGAFVPSGTGRTYPAGRDGAAAARAGERRPAGAGARAEPERPVHRCADPEWSRAHGMGRIRFLGRNSTYCGRCKKGFEYLSAIAKICPCCGEEA